MTFLTISRLVFYSELAETESRNSEFPFQPALILFTPLFLRLRHAFLLFMLAKNLFINGMISFISISSATFFQHRRNSILKCEGEEGLIIVLTWSEVTKVDAFYAVKVIQTRNTS